MAKKQQIILLHGTSALTENTPGLVQGEVAVYNAAEAKDVEIYATNSKDEIVAFQSKAATQAAIDAVNANVELEVAALEGALSAETEARKAADSAITEAYEAADAALGKRIDDEVTARTEDVRLLNVALSAETEAREGADEAMDARVKAIEELVGTGEGEGTLAVRVGELEDAVELLNGDAETVGSVANAVAVADAAVRKDFADADDVVRGEFAAADSKVREDFAAADTQIRTDFAAADTALGKRIDDEVTARTEADTALGKRIDDEVTARENAITAVTAAYEAADEVVRGEFAAADTALEAKLRKEYQDADAVVTKAFQDADTALTATLRGEIADAKNEVVSGYTQAIEGVQNQINTLNGEANVPGSVKNTVDAAINKFATDMTDNGTIDTFKELVDYAATHGTEFSELVAEVSAITADYKAEDAKIREEFAAADTALEAKLRKEYQDADKVLDGKIADEVTARTEDVRLLNVALSAETEARKNAITAVTAAYELADEGLSARIKTIEDAKPVYEIAMAGEYGDKVVVEKTENKYTLNFDAFVIDGGTY